MDDVPEAEDVLEVLVKVSVVIGVALPSKAVGVNLSVRLRTSSIRLSHTTGQSLIPLRQRLSWPALRIAASATMLEASMICVRRIPASLLILKAQI